MKKLTKTDLLNVIDDAIIDFSDFVFVALKAEDTFEIITIPYFSLPKKRKFYDETYREDLTHVMNKNVEIIGVSHGSSKELFQIVGEYSS